MVRVGSLIKEAQDRKIAVTAAHSRLQVMEALWLMRMRTLRVRVVLHTTAAQ